ncbi:MAG: AMP-binding protein, partial [Vulcanimicrobiaceae bacterium]
GLDKLLFFVSGSAPLHLDTAMTMLACDITILEGYGLTECSPVVTASRLEDHRYGTVGKALPGVQIKIAEDGEILTKGPNVMKGYYKDPEATAAVFEDGWFETGDIGAVDADGYVRITDRKRELFKTSGGKFVAPARVESAIKRSVYVNQVLLVGYGRPHPAALVLPNWDLLRRDFHLSPEIATSEIAAREDVQRLITEEVRRTTSDLASYEQVRRVVVLPRDLTVERGELSPTLKVRRRVVEDNYAAEIERVYRLDLHESPHA